MNTVRAFFLVLHTVFRRRRDLILENLALRQQLLVQQRTIKRPKLRNGDRCSWAWLSRVWPDWKSTLSIVKPETVVKWHRQRFKLYWRRKSEAGTVGRPKISQEIRDLIRQMSRENPTWGAPRIQSELKLIGFESLCRKSDRLDPERMFGSLHHLQREALVSGPWGIC